VASVRCARQRKMQRAATGRRAARLTCATVRWPQVLERWLVSPYPGQLGSLSPKEAILIAQRLAALEKAGLFDPPPSPPGMAAAAAAQAGGSGGPGGLRRAWDAAFLPLVLRLSTPPPPPVRGSGLPRPVDAHTVHGAWLLGRCSASGPGALGDRQGVVVDAEAPSHGAAPEKTRVLLCLPGGRAAERRGQGALYGRGAPLP
jgi:hypothetical protein